jgi:hypothetical protein
MTIGPTQLYSWVRYCPGSGHKVRLGPVHFFCSVFKVLTWRTLPQPPHASPLMNAVRRHMPRSLHFKMYPQANAAAVEWGCTLHSPICPAGHQWMSSQCPVESSGVQFSNQTIQSMSSGFQFGHWTSSGL